ncbi:MAG TPA: tripartite tricarboxylate transporter TctB family protein [Xanthobacteraceae bacterium]|nr:tripartite tricarboxylate transporter TctB family protein [Xanthobacteraceae bacterium]
MNVSRSKDFWAGIMFLGFAAVAMVAARGYTLGSAGRMGPGYFPMVLGLLLGVLGLIIAARSLLTADNRIDGLKLQPLLFLVAGVCLFGLLIERLGLVLTLIAVVAVAAFASRESRSVEVAALAAVLAVFSLAIFVYVLRLPLLVWPNFFG